MKKLKISPSLMCADFLNMKRDLDIFIEQKIDYLHIDIMDGHYVPNFTLGVDFCRAVASHTDIPLDIHLMIENVDSHIPDFSQFKNAVISFHPEVSAHPIRTIQLIKSYGIRAGIALDPALALETIRYLLPEVDLVCSMTVNPGYAGQKLIPGAIEKIRDIADFIRREGYHVEIEVDGNVSWENLPQMLEAGARIFVAGSSSLFEAGGSLRKNIERFRSILNHYTDTFTQGKK